MVCTGNICRSPMAEGLLQAMLPAGLRSQVEVASAGTHALHGHQPASHAVTVMGQAGIDIRSHRARQVSRDMVADADLTLVMEKAHAQYFNRMVFWKRPRIRLLTQFDHRYEDQKPPEIEDPYGLPLESYEACLRILRPCIDGVIHWLRTHEDFTTADRRDA
ncbi:low molecular weight protein-tyrosine-phosphatase [Desulfatitalea alkaliphila]|nr:low molecular weight protein-tyrosine-phosphatase [Desulfatitalea alkaliphila]